MAVIKWEGHVQTAFSSQTARITHRHICNRHFCCCARLWSGLQDGFAACLQLYFTKLDQEIMRAPSPACGVSHVCAAAAPAAPAVNPLQLS